MNFSSPLRYPGGKGKITSFIEKIFEDNFLLDGCYVEPYAGGASVALSLLFNEYASKIVINDVDRSIYAFWHSVLNKPGELCRLINDAKIDMDTWLLQKEIQHKKNNASLLALGFSTFYLNRTNRSGIISGGIIGGYNQSGAWKMDARFNKKDLMKRIERVAEYASRISLHNSDALDLIKIIEPNLPAKTLIYFDPPYYVKGKALYVNYYEHEDHVAVSNIVTRIKKQKWIVSYDDVVQINELYRQHRKLNYSIGYSAANVRKGAEIMIFSDNLSLPNKVNCVSPRH